MLNIPRPSGAPILPIIAALGLLCLQLLATPVHLPAVPAHPPANVPTYVQESWNDDLDGEAEADWPEWRIRNIAVHYPEQPGSILEVPTAELSGYMRDFMILQKGELADSLLLEEAAWTLMQSGQFEFVKYLISEFAPREADIAFLVVERKTFMPAANINIGGEQEDAGVSLYLPGLPLAGHEAMFGPISAGYLYSSENGGAHNAQAAFMLPLTNSGFSTAVEIDFRAYSEGDSNQTALNWKGEVGLPFRSPYDEFSFGLRADVHSGRSFDYRSAAPVIQDQSARFEAWFSRGFIREDRFFVSALAGFMPLADDDNQWREAAEGSGYILLGFSSLAQEFGNEMLNSDNQVINPLGAVGNVAFGKFFPVGSDGEHFVYAGGSAASSTLVTPDIYLFGKIGAGSGFRDGAARYTHLRTEGLGHAFFTDDLVLAGRVQQQTSWNWPAQRQAVLDNHAGLRGFPANSLVGDNSLLASLEMRWTPLKLAQKVSLETALFYDAGVIWNLDQQIAAQRVNSAAGIGLRLHHDWFGGKNLVRLDLAYNVNAAELGQVILSTSMPFRLFGSHDFELPALVGAQFDRR